MLRLILLLCITSLLAACVPASTEPTSTPSPLRILALGDSYTIGQSVVEADRWPVQLAARLREQGLAVLDPQIIARTGWTTDDLSAGISEQQPSGPFDLVFLMIGVNDEYQGRKIDTYRTGLQALLAQANEFAGQRPGRVIVLSIPDWTVTPFAEGSDQARLAANIAEFNAVNRAEAEQAGAVYVDVTPISQLARGQRDLLAGDGLHPSAKMYARWVDLLLPAVLKALQ